MSNPNPGLITNEMWKMWEERPNSNWKLGGIYADKPGYHNTVNTNINKWPDNYSIELDIDRKSPINRDKARAIDYTMSDSEMVKWTRRMKASAEDPKDHRLDAVKEFYGTLDNKNVFGLKKTSPNGTWSHSTADSSHLWHGHVSIFTPYVNNWMMLSPILSVMSGQSLSDWGNGMPLPALNDKGEDVRYWQHIHNTVAPMFNPPLTKVDADGEYGLATAAAIKSFWQAIGGTGTYDGKYLHGWTAKEYQKKFIESVATVKPVVTPDPEQIRSLVNEWLKENVPNKLRLTAAVDGMVSLSE